jgi:restriction endonuclease S subunit
MTVSWFRDLSDKINIDYSIIYHLTAITSQQAVGAIFKNLTTSVFKNLEIPLPPLPIQKRIAEILDTADALRRKDEALLKNTMSWLKLFLSICSATQLKMKKVGR